MSLEICGKWILGFYACLAWTGSDVILSTSSIMHLCAIAIHRYRGIAFPLHTRNATSRHVAALVIPAWSIAVALSVPFIVQATIHQSYVLQAVVVYPLLQVSETQKMSNGSLMMFLHAIDETTSHSVDGSSRSTESEIFLLETTRRRTPVQSLQVRFQEEEDELAMHCGIFNHVFAIYSSMVSFFIPLAVMVFADIGSIRTLRRNASSKLKTPSKLDQGSTRSNPGKSKNFLEPYPSSVDRVSSENISASTLISPVTPTFRGQRSSQERVQRSGQACPKQSPLFFTESSNQAPSASKLAHCVNGRSRQRFLLPSKRQREERPNEASAARNALRTSDSFLWRTTTDGDSSLRAQPDSSRFAGGSQTRISSSGYCEPRGGLKILGSLGRSKKSVLTAQRRCNGEPSRHFNDLLRDPEIQTNNRCTRPRTRSLMRMEMHSRPPRVSGRERRAEKTLIWVFLLFVALWLPFFCTNLAYGICGDAPLLAESYLNNQSLLSSETSLPSSSSSSSPPSSSSSSSSADESESKSVCHIPADLLSLFTWLGYLSSGVNPCIYTLLNKDFRRAFKNTLMCRKMRSTRSRSRPTFLQRGAHESDLLDWLDRLRRYPWRARSRPCKPRDLVLATGMKIKHERDIGNSTERIIFFNSVVDDLSGIIFNYF